LSYRQIPFDPALFPRPFPHLFLSSWWSFWFRPQAKRPQFAQYFSLGASAEAMHKYHTVAFRNAQRWRVVFVRWALRHPAVPTASTAIQRQGQALSGHRVRSSRADP
jgi:hypothetical protein